MASLQSSARSRAQTSFFMLIALWLISAVTGVAAQDSSHVTLDGVAVTIESLERARTALPTSGLDEAQRTEAGNYLDRAGVYLSEAEASRDRLKQLRERIADAPRTVEAANAKLRSPKPDPADLDGLGTAALESRAAELQVNVAQARERQKRHEDELAGLLNGAKGLSADISTKASELATLNVQSPPAADGDTNLVAQARRWALEAERGARRAELDLLEARLGSHGILTSLARAQSDLAVENVTALTRELERTNATLATRRADAAREARESAEAVSREAAVLPPPMQRVAADTAAFRAEHERLLAQRKRFGSELATTRDELGRLRADFDSDQQRVAAVGSSEAIGRMLRRRRDALPAERDLQRSMARVHQAISVAADRQVELHEFRRAQSSTAPMELMAGLNEAEQARLTDEVSGVLRDRGDALADLEQGYGGAITQLSGLQLDLRELSKLGKAYQGYIDDQLLEIRAPGLWSASNVPRVLHGLAWFVSPANWKTLGNDALAVAQHEPIALLLLAGLVIGLLGKCAVARRRIGELALATYKIRTDRFSLTAEALGWTLVTVAPWPLLLVGSGWLLQRSPDAAVFTEAVARGLFVAGLALAGGRLLQHFCGTDGLADRHLRWFAPLRTALYRELRWAIPAVVLLLFLITAAGDADLPVEEQVLAQATFIILMLTWMVFSWRLMRPHSDVMMALAQVQRAPLLRQLHFLWFPAALLVPLVLAVLAGYGYQALALAVHHQAELSFWFLLGLWVMRDLLLRYLSISERGLRFDEAVRRREELRSRRLAASEHPEEEPAQPLEPPELNFSELGEQAQRVVRVTFLFAAVAGLWVLWSELATSLDVIQHTSISLTGTEASGETSALTLGGLLFALLLVGVTLLAAKNIPGVMEIALLQRLPLDSGTRYTVTTMTQYLIAGTGLIMALGTLGLQWEKLQWLVAALGVGVGFGLQEIVANFISGIILLFERPIRVGDVVTLDGTTGVVSRIKIRATAITNYDRQELLIPNKEFITGRVINWTLSDKINRIVITVGLAYGSDVDRAMALMLEAAQENDNVLDDPKPVTSFESFGDNALTLLLRSYLGDLENRLATISALHKAINTKFEQAEMVIAFPQRDLHLDADKPLDIRLHRASEGPR